MSDNPFELRFQELSNKIIDYKQKEGPSGILGMPKKGEQ